MQQHRHTGKQPGHQRRSWSRQRERPGPERTLFGLAGEVIGKADTEHPADAVLRAVLAAQGGLIQQLKTEVSRAVFTYYRWRGWLKNERSVEARLARTLELDEQFRKNPSSLPVEELRSNAIPGWVSEEMPVRDDWLRSLQREPRLWLRAKQGQGSDLAKMLGSARVFSPRPGQSAVPDAVGYDGEKDLFATEEFHSGAFEIQDVSSQLVGLLCGPKAGETWWDACAGEGGKTLHLSDLMENKGLIWASDRAEWRLKKLKQRAARAGMFNYRAALWNGGASLPTKTKFDGVLVDAPCSGVGTWQRNPHARWTTTPRDVRELAAVQKQLLENVAGSVKPGGKLVYAVCALTRSETAGVAEAFGNAHPEFEPIALAVPPPENENSRTLSSAATIWPQDYGGNGMFIAAWRRRAAGKEAACPAIAAGTVSNSSG